MIVCLHVPCSLCFALFQREITGSNNMSRGPITNTLAQTVYASRISIARVAARARKKHCPVKKSRGNCLLVNVVVRPVHSLLKMSTSCTFCAFCATCSTTSFSSWVARFERKRPCQRPCPYQRPHQHQRQRPQLPLPLQLLQQQQVQEARTRTSAPSRRISS